MQIELTLSPSADGAYSPRDLGFLLHKNPDHVHIRETAAGKASIFFTEASEARATALLHLDVDPVGLVRGRSREDSGLLDQYVNDRPYVANSFLSVALSRAFGQSMSGRSKERQDLAERPLPLTARVVPVAVSGGMELIETLFAPLGYTIETTILNDDGMREIHDLFFTGHVHLSDLLKHIYVLVPVLDDAKHWYIDKKEIENLLTKGEGWLASHPAKDLIAQRALKRRRALVHEALERLEENALTREEPDEGSQTPAPEPEAVLETPIRLHDLRLDRVLEVVKDVRAEIVLDLGCGEGKLLGRLKREQGIKRILGVDPSVRTLEKAARRLNLATAGEKVRERIGLQLGSLTYGDRRWHGFDVATLVEVIEHIDPPRLSALELSLFGDAKPATVIITTPNREYNVLFEGMAEKATRHPDHRFEWTREEFEAWATKVCQTYHYNVRFEALGPMDETHGAPSQMAIFTYEGVGPAP